MATAEPAIRVSSARFVRINLAAAITGLTEKAIERKIARGVWLEGKHYRKADGNIWVDMKAFERWVETASA